MKGRSIRDMPSAELIELFVSLCIAQGNAIEREETKLYNSRYKLVEDIKNELRSRPGDHRRALTALLTHPNPQVRLSAAHATLALDPAARSALEALRQQPWLAQALDAGSALDALDSGLYRPN